MTSGCNLLILYKLQKGQTGSLFSRPSQEKKKRSESGVSEGKSSELLLKLVY